MSAKNARNIVVDVLYCDIDRISSFIAQLGGIGKTEKVTRKSTKKATKPISASAGLSAKLEIAGSELGTQFGIDLGQEDTAETGSERIFDPYWSDAIKFLSYLKEKKLVSELCGESTLGSFVIGSGSLKLIDVGLMQNMWEQPFLKKHMFLSASNNSNTSEVNRHARRAQIKTSNNSSNDEVELMLGMVKSLPHSVQAMLFGEYQLWTTLQPKYILGDSSSIVLKHGFTVPGLWKILGILDAFPYDPASLSDEGETEDELIAKVFYGHVSAMAGPIGNLARNILGRPNFASGLTPLLIYREMNLL